MVKTPSSWEDSFFICSDRTCASSRMENSVSASQYPQERHEQINTKLQQTANNPRGAPSSGSRTAARGVGLKPGDVSVVRRAMMAEGLQPGRAPSG